MATNRIPCTFSLLTEGRKYTGQHRKYLIDLVVGTEYGGMPPRPEVVKVVRLTAPRVDGGINVKTAARAIAAGADTLVAGSAVYGKPDRAAAIAALRG